MGMWMVMSQSLSERHRKPFECVRHRTGWVVGVGRMMTVDFHNRHEYSKLLIPTLGSSIPFDDVSRARRQVAVLVPDRYHTSHRFRTVFVPHRTIELQIDNIQKSSTNYCFSFSHGSGSEGGSFGVRRWNFIAIIVECSSVCAEFCEGMMVAWLGSNRISNLQGRGDRHSRQWHVTSKHPWRNEFPPQITCSPRPSFYSLNFRFKLKIA